MTNQLVSFKGGIVNSDSNATASTVVQRDSQGAVANTSETVQTLVVTGDTYKTIHNVSATYTVDNAGAHDTTIWADATSAAFAITLVASSANTNRELRFVKLDAAHNVTITAAGSDTINGAATYVLSSQYQKVTITTDGSGKWIAIA
jgi:BRCT domain type II-containing protein